MAKFFRKQLTYFLIGFVAAFVLYLFIRFSADAVLLGVVIGTFAGAALCVALGLLERRFDDDPAPTPAKK